jgi:hypothetical protein
LPNALLRTSKPTISAAPPIRLSSIMDALRNLLSDPATLKVFGNDLLIFGLVGDIIVLFVPSSRKVLEKVLAAFFIVLIITGIVIERTADSRIQVANDRAAAEEKDRLMRQMSARQVNGHKLSLELQGKQKPSFVEIVFFKGDLEAYLLAKQIHAALVPLNWLSSDPIPKTGEELVREVPTPVPEAVADIPPRGLIATVRDR